MLAAGEIRRGRMTWVCQRTRGKIAAKGCDYLREHSPAACGGCPWADVDHTWPCPTWGGADKPS